MFSGAVVTISVARACCSRDEVWHHVPGGLSVPQNLHQKTWKCQVQIQSYKPVIISSQFVSSVTNIFYIFSILFADIVGFTNLSSQCSAQVWKKKISKSKARLRLVSCDWFHVWLLTCVSGWWCNKNGWVLLLENSGKQWKINWKWKMFWPQSA